MGDLFLLGVVVRMFSSPGARTASYRMLVCSLGATLSADIAWNIYSVVTGDTGSHSLERPRLAGQLRARGRGRLRALDADGGRARAVAATGRATMRRLLMLTLGLTLPAVAC